MLLKQCVPDVFGVQGAGAPPVRFCVRACPIPSAHLPRPRFSSCQSPLNGFHVGAPSAERRTAGPGTVTGCAAVSTFDAGSAP